jgi:hypothetical protein
MEFTSENGADVDGGDGGQGGGGVGGCHASTAQADGGNSINVLENAVNLSENVAVAALIANLLSEQEHPMVCVSPVRV